MKFRNLVLASVILFFLFSATAFCAAGDGKVTMEEWIKIINSKGSGKSQASQTDKVKDGDVKNNNDPTPPPEIQGIAVTIYWHMADNADVYLNGKPLRNYEPSFKTRPDEAPQPAFSARAIIKNGDVFTVGGRRGGSFGLMLIAVDAQNNIVFMTDRDSWKVYEPGEKPDWFSPTVALNSPAKPVTVQPDPWYPQKQLNAKYGNKALSIWSLPSHTFVYLFGIVSKIR